MLFGDGGTLESYLGAVPRESVASAQMRVLYEDWELGGEDHRERLERALWDGMPPVHYIRCDRPCRTRGTCSVCSSFPLLIEERLQGAHLAEILGVSCNSLMDRG